MNIKNYEQLLTAENHILEKGYVCYEDLVQVVEYRPWIIGALSEWLDLLPIEVKHRCSKNIISDTDYFKAVNQFLRSNLENLPVGLFNGEVYVN